MGYDGRLALPEGSVFSIREENGQDGSKGNAWTAAVAEEIGRGGSCLVYRGTLRSAVGKEAVDRPVIIKEFYPKALDGALRRTEDGSLSCRPDAKETFDQRLSAFCAGQARHILFSARNASRALPPLFASGWANGTFYAVSSPGQGVSMDRLDRRELTLVQALRQMVSVSDAIGSVHRQGMQLYLDLKPANIYLDGDRAYLFDFDTVQPKERLRYCSYSPGWSAPEQVVGDDAAGYANRGRIGFHTDIYAVAAVFFYLLTGRGPARDELAGIREPSDWKRLITLRDPTGALDSGVFTAELDRVMRAALEPDPERRALDYGGTRAAAKIRNEWEALEKIAESVPDRRGHEQTRASVAEVKEAVESARETIEKAVENTARSRSLKALWFGSPGRIALSVSGLALLTALLGLLVWLCVRMPRPAFPAGLFQEEDINRHLVMTLENGNHSYEVGLSNWRRLDYARAERDLASAFDQLSAEFSQDHPELAKVNNALGCLYLDMGKYEQAYDCLNSAYVVFRRQKGENAAETMAVLFSVAQYDYLTGDPETAQKTLARILERMDTSAHPGAAACMLHSRAQIHFELGDHDAARNDYEKALSLFRDIMENGRPAGELADYSNETQLTENEKDFRRTAVRWTVRTWTAMAENELSAGNVQAAKKTLEQALEVCLKDLSIGRRNLLTARVYQGLALACQAEGKRDEALEAADLAMRIELNLFNFEEDYPGLTEVYGILGTLLTEDGKLTEAGKYSEKSLAIARNAYGENHFLTAKAYDQNGLYQQALGNLPGAAAAFERAVEIRRNILGYRHPETVRYLLHLACAAGEQGDQEKLREAAEEARKLCEALQLQGDLPARVNGL